MFDYLWYLRHNGLFWIRVHARFLSRDHGLNVSLVLPISWSYCNNRSLGHWSKTKPKQYPVPCHWQSIIEPDMGHRILFSRENDPIVTCICRVSVMGKHNNYFCNHYEILRPGEWAYSRGETDECPPGQSPAKDLPLNDLQSIVCSYSMFYLSNGFSRPHFFQNRYP